MKEDAKKKKNYDKTIDKTIQKFFIYRTNLYRDVQRRRAALGREIKKISKNFIKKLDTENAPQACGAIKHSPYKLEKWFKDYSVTKGVNNNERK